MSGPGADRRRLSLWSAALVAVGGALISRGLPLWWVGGAMLVAAAALLHRAWGERLPAVVDRLRRPLRLGRLRIVPAEALPELLCLGLIATVATLMMADVFAGERPVSYDHTVHYFKAHQLHTRFLPQGRLYGWSQRWFAGYPVNYLYPIGADLWVNFVYMLGFGLLSFSRAYGIAFWLMHLLSGVAAYRFGKLVGGRAVGLVTGLLLITDLSAFRHGGWAYTVVYGVWPQALSLAFAMLALCHLPALFERRGTRAVGAFGLWMGLAILCHPMALVFMAVLLVGSALAAAFADGVRAPSGIVRLLGGYAVASLVACTWLLPFLSTRRQTTPMGVWWDTTYEMARGLWELTMLPGTIGYVLAFGLCGLLLSLRSRRFVLLLSAWMCLIVPVLFSSTFVDELRLPELASAFAKVQYLRISTMVKPFWFALAGYFIVLLVRRGKRLLPDGAARGPAPNALRAGVYALLLGLVVLPIAVPAAQLFYSKHVSKSLRTVHDRQFQADRKKLTAWLSTHLPRDRFYRVGIFTAHNHDLFDLASELDFPVYKRGFTPCANFVYKMNSPEADVLQAVGVRFVIVKKMLPEADFELLERFGIYRVYRYLHYRPEPYQVVSGQADVRLRRFEDERVDLDVGPGAHGKLRLSVSWFPRWKAYRDGHPVPISVSSLEAEPDTTGFITVPLSEGRYSFVFERSLVDRLAVPVGLLGLLLAAGLMLIDGRGLTWLSRAADTLDALSSPAFARLRVSLLAAAGAALLAAVVLLSEWRPPLTLGGELSDLRIRGVRFDFLEELSRAHVWHVFGDRARHCRRRGERFVCPDAEGDIDTTNYVASSPATIEEYRMVRCIRARPQERGPLRIRFNDVPRGDAIVGYYGVEFEGRLLFRERPVRFTVDLGRTRVYEGKTTEDNHMYWFKVPLPEGEPTVSVRFGVDAGNVHKRWLCFHAQVVDL